MTTTPTRRKRPIRVFGAAAALLALGAAATGCSSSGSSAKAGKLSIQFVSPLPSYPTFKTLGDCMKTEANKLGADFTVTGPTGQAPDPTTMIAQIQQATVAKKGAIVTVPLGAGFTPVLQQAQKKGILTVTLLGTGGKDSGADLNLTYDWTVIGKQYVDAIAKLSGQQNVGLVAAANTGSAKQWTDAVTAAAAATSNVKIVSTVYTGDDATKALPQVDALLTAHPDINMIATNLGTATPGAVAAIKAKSLTGKVHLLVNGSDNGGTEALNAGIANLMFVQDVCGTAAKAIDALIDLSKKKTVPPASFGTTVIAKDQLQTYLGKGWS